MRVFELVIVLLLLGAALAAGARRIGAPYPALLALAGAALALMPGVPAVTLDPGAGRDGRGAAPAIGAPGRRHHRR